MALLPPDLKLRSVSISNINVNVQENLRFNLVSEIEVSTQLCLTHWMLSHLCQVNSMQQFITQAIGEFLHSNKEKH